MAKIGILTGGGDAPGLNAAIKWVVKHSIDEGLANEVIGIKYGWKGLLTLDTLQLNERVVRTWDRDGGTHLGSSRTNPFNVKEQDESQRALDNLTQLDLDYLVAMGGEDTLGVASKLFDKGVKVVGIPKTIDGDIPGTDYSLGLSSAVEENRQLINKLRNPAGSHEIIYVVEVMGRNSGYLALYSGIAGAASVILIPEHPFDIGQVVHRLVERRIKGARYDIVVVSEGAKESGKELVVKGSEVDSFGHEALGGIGAYLAREIKKRTSFETRDNKPGHIQRGAPPNAYDVMMGRFFGIGAVELLKEGRIGYMVSLKKGEISSTPLEEIKGSKHVEVASQYDTQRLNAKRTTNFSLF